MRRNLHLPFKINKKYKRTRLPYKKIVGRNEIPKYDVWNFLVCLAWFTYFFSQALTDLFLSTLQPTMAERLVGSSKVKGIGGKQLGVWRDRLHQRTSILVVTVGRVGWHPAPVDDTRAH